MSTMGADLEQLAQLQAAFGRQSQALEDVVSSMRSQLVSTTWHGPAADRFRAAWTSEYEPALRRLQAGLQDAGSEVGRRREALLRAGA